MQQYASAFRYLNSAINFKPKEAIIYSLMASKKQWNWNLKIKI